MSDIKTLEIPKWGLSMEEGSIGKWLIQEGESFTKKQEVCEIETSKIVNALEAQFDGTLRKIIAQEGDTLPVGGVIAVCADMSVSDAEIQAFIEKLDTVAAGKNPEIEQDEVINNPEIPASAKPQQSTSDQTSVGKSGQPASKLAEASTLSNLSTQSGGSKVYDVPQALQGYQKDSGVAATMHAIGLAEQLNINLEAITPTARGERVSVRDIENAIKANGGKCSEPKALHASRSAYQAKPSTLDDTNVAATPVARRLAKQWGVNLHDCRPTGTRGRVCKEDVESAKHRFEVSKASGDTATNSIDMLQTQPQSTVIPMNSMRKAIASRLQAAKRNAPHFRLTVDLNVEQLQALRTQINTNVPHVKLSINDMLIKAIAAALMKVPEVNVQFDEEKQQIIQFAQADISVAVAIENGLITPIIKAANTKPLAQISDEMRDLATRAKTGRLQTDEFQGGSFSLSNLGMLGIKQFDAIINPPQGAILAVGATQEQAVVENGMVVIRPIMTATLSCDHRVIDGALGAKFLASLKQFVENPSLILV